MIKAIPSRNPELSAGHWNDAKSRTTPSPSDDKSRLNWPRRETIVILEVAKKSRGGVYLTIEEVTPHGEETVEVVKSDQVFYQADNLMIPARPDSGVDMRPGTSGPGPKTDNGGKKEDANKEN